ncbi:MAG: efflux RND transporter permease subunit, partial [Gemmatimonadaceae bacterium]|nr:efflux RND transporter permease subunit [Gemmatimonadaceae bacterium]
MSLPRLSIRRPVAVAMVFFAIVLVGVLSFRRLPIDLLPDIAYPKLVVFTSYPNVAPSEVERFITERVEQGVSAVPGVERVESISREGISLVTLRFAWGTDMDFAALNVRERLDNMRGQLPERADRSVVMRTDPASEPVMSLSVSGRNDLWSLRNLAESVIRRRLEQIDGVARAAVVGGLEREIHVDVDTRLLESYGLTIDDVATALAGANASAPGGTILRGRYRYALRTLGEFQSVDEIAAVPITRRGEARGAGGASAATSGGAAPEASATATRGVITLRDVAQIEDGSRERETIARYNGRDAVGLLLFKESGANTVRVAEQVNEVLVQLRREYPEITLDIASSQAGFISASIANVVQEVIVGGILAFLVLFLFLRDARYPVAIALAIPISIVATFALFDAAGVSLNIMTLGGLALGVGLLMDNSIVVIENIFRNRELGLPMREAAAVGAEEVQRAIVASTLTTIAVFGPIIYVRGVAGKLFGALSLSVAFALSASVLVALMLLPALAARWEGGGDAAKPGRIRSLLRRAGARVGASVERLVRRPLDSFDDGFARLMRWYERILLVALAHRGRVVALSAVLLAGTIALALTLERSVLPRVDQGAFQARIELPRGTPLQETSALAERIERAALGDSAVTAVFTRAGRQEAIFGVDERQTGIN